MLTEEKISDLIDAYGLNTGAVYAYSAPQVDGSIIIHGFNSRGDRTIPARVVEGKLVYQK